MWKDTREARRKRYEGYLKLCRTLSEPAEALRQSGVFTAGGAY